MTESLEIIPYLASPEVGEVSRSDGEVLQFCHFFRVFSDDFCTKFLQKA